MATKTILDKFYQGGPLQGLDIVDCHSHMGPALYMNVPDADADSLVRVLDDLGVSTACIAGHTIGMVSDWKLGNDLLISACRKYPQRYFGYTVFNPRYPDQMSAEMERCANAGLRGIKLHPDFHRMPANDRLYNAAYEFAQSGNRVMMLHYGCTEAQFAGYHLYNEALQRFPKVTCIMAHSLPTPAAIENAKVAFGNNENVYFDLSNAFPAGMIELAVKRLGVERLLHGTDGCWSNMSPMLGAVCCADLPDHDKQLILGGNMRRLMSQCA